MTVAGCTTHATPDRVFMATAGALAGINLWLPAALTAIAGTGAHQALLRWHAIDAIELRIADLASDEARVDLMSAHYKFPMNPDNEQLTNGCLVGFWRLAAAAVSATLSALSTAFPQPESDNFALCEVIRTCIIGPRIERACFGVRILGHLQETALNANFWPFHEFFHRHARDLRQGQRLHHRAAARSFEQLRQLALGHPGAAGQFYLGGARALHPVLERGVGFRFHSVMRLSSHYANLSSDFYRVRGGPCKP